MTVRPSQLAAIAFALLASSLLAQNTDPAPAPKPDDPHDISMVETAPIGGSIAVPLPERQQRRLKKYELPELTGSRQALGPQLIDGELPLPIADFLARSGGVLQRISIFEPGLVVADVEGTGGVLRKKVLIPPESLKTYREKINAVALASVPQHALTPPVGDSRRATLRIYDAHRDYVERSFDPMSSLPKALGDQVLPLEDLLRAISEDRTVTNTVANYEPKPGDRLVGDDQKVYRIERVIGLGDEAVVALRCEDQPTSMYVAKKDLYNYFVGKPRND